MANRDVAPNYSTALQICSTTTVANFALQVIKHMADGYRINGLQCANNLMKF